MKIYMFIDESGVLSPNSKYKIFLFGGICFLNSESKDKCSNAYKKGEKLIKQKIIYNDFDELKGSVLKKQDMNYLYSLFKKEYTFIGSSKINELSRINWKNKKAVRRYKDWFLVMLIKEKINFLIKKELINIYDSHSFYIFIDNQDVATNGKYNFEESLYEEFFNGKYTSAGFKDPVFKNEGILKVKYIDSKINPLIRAADILCNKKYRKIKNNEKIEGKYTILYHP